MGNANDSKAALASEVETGLPCFRIRRMSFRIRMTDARKLA